MKYQNIMTQVMLTPWAIKPEKFQEIMAFLNFKVNGGEVSEEEIAALKRAARTPVYFQAAAVPQEKSDGKDDTGAWDGPAAVERLRKWASTDGSGDKDKMDWGKYERGFAWYDQSNKEDFASYKLPHHDVKDGKLILVLSGVEAAMEALLGARGGTDIPTEDRKAVYNHLAAEYREFGKEPPPFHGEALSGAIEARSFSREEICDVFAVSPEAISAGPTSSSRSKAGSIAVLPITGTISHRMGMLSQISGGTSTQQFTQWLRAAVADPTVKAIVMDIDSPGGSVDGVPELADEIAKAKSVKPVMAVANTQAASAAYWLGCQASELCVSPSASVGSIGVFAAHEDVSKAAENAGVKVTFVSAGKYKTEGNPYEPLSEDAKQALQAQVDDYYGQFVKAVSKGRNVSAQDVRDGFGQGRMVNAQQAVKMGMADRVATLDQTLARLGAKTTAKAPVAVSAPADNSAKNETPAWQAELRRRELELLSIG